MLSFLASFNELLNTYKNEFREYSYISEILDKQDMAKNKIEPRLATLEYDCLAASISFAVTSPIWIASEISIL